MHYFSLPEGHILTTYQKDEIKKDGKVIRVMPVWKWMLSGRVVNEINNTK